MVLRIADKFNESLGRLTSKERTAVKATVYDLQVRQARPGMGLEKIERIREKNFCSVRSGRDLRVIVHRTDGRLVFCYADHHDAAYRWAERYWMETHPTTGAAQLVEIRERVEEITVTKAIEAAQAEAAKPALFARIPAEKLLAYGVPKEWLPEVRLATEDSVLDLAVHRRRLETHPRTGAA